MKNMQYLKGKIIKLFLPHNVNYVAEKGIYIIGKILFSHIIYICYMEKYRHIIYRRLKTWKNT